MTGMKWNDFVKDKLFKNKNRLSNWREKGEIVVYIHTNTEIHRRLFHMVPYAGIREEEGRRLSAIVYLPFVCHESVKSWIERTPPESCPMCKYFDWLKTNGMIGDDELVWNATVGDRKRDRVCRKADFLGDTDAGGDWKLSFKPTLQYIIPVIDYAKPADGIRIATEKYSLGEAIKKTVIQEMDRRGNELGDPARNPYAFKWVFNPQARTPNEFYQVYAFGEKAPVTPEIAALLAEPAQDIAEWVTPGDVKQLKVAMEASIPRELNVPLDTFFVNALTTSNNLEDAEYDVAEEAPPPAKPAPTPTKKTSTPRAAAATQPTPPAVIDTPPTKPSNPAIHQQKCPICRGTGKKKDLPCKVCDGTGMIEIDDDSGDATPAPAVTAPAEKPAPVQSAPKAEPATAPRERKVAAAPPPKPTPPKSNVSYLCPECNANVGEDDTECPQCHAQFE